MNFPCVAAFLVVVVVVVVVVVDLFCTTPPKHDTRTFPLDGSLAVHHLLPFLTALLPLHTYLSYPQLQPLCFYSRDIIVNVQPSPAITIGGTTRAPL
jgi:hypothetical protein